MVRIVRHIIFGLLLLGTMIPNALSPQQPTYLNAFSLHPFQYIAFRILIDTIKKLDLETQFFYGLV